MAELEINEKYLKIIFAFFLFFVAIKIFFGFKLGKGIKKITKKVLFFMGYMIGVISAILGISGGVVSVSFLSYLNVPIKKIAGTSSCFALIIAIIGTISFIILGKNITVSQKYFLGYIYLPALFFVAFFAVLFAHLGARLTQLIPSKILQRVFGIVLFFLSIYMFFNNF